MPRAPRPGDTVAVLEFGKWLDGSVVEANEASGEFLVEFSDEAEVPAWVSISQPWRLLTQEVPDDASAEAAEPAPHALNGDAGDNGAAAPDPSDEPASAPTEAAAASQRLACEAAARSSCGRLAAVGRRRVRLLIHPPTRWCRCR